MKKILIALCIATPLLFSGCFMNEMLRISVDFPHGETRLLVISSGEAYLFYGAKSEYQTIKKGTFDIKEVRKGFKDKLQPFATTEKREGMQYGMVAIDYGDNKRDTFIITDGTYALQLFDTARKSIVLKKK